MTDLRITTSRARANFLDAAETLLRDGDMQERATAAGVLGSLGDETYVPVLLEVLREDANRQVRHKASWALARVGGQAAIDGLRVLMREEDQYTRFLAAEALTHILTHGNSDD